MHFNTITPINMVALFLCVRLEHDQFKSDHGAIVRNLCILMASTSVLHWMIFDVFDFKKRRPTIVARRYLILMWVVVGMMTAFEAVRSIDYGKTIDDILQVIIATCTIFYINALPVLFQCIVCTPVVP